jgi:5'-3' exonuclease
MKSKLTLVVDGNWLLMSRLAVMNGRYPNLDELLRELKLLMVRSTNLVLKTFPAIDNIIFVADGGSWRNNITEIPEFLKNEGIEYKGNRAHSLDIDWDAVFADYESFLNLLSKNGINVCRERNIEGDDWCAWWSYFLNNEGTNVIIWSKDKDLTQLVKTDNNGCFTVCWNKENGVTCFRKDDDEFNFLFNNAFSENDKIFRSICSKSVDTLHINPNQVIVDKIIRGDAGDNIMPIIVKKPQSQTSRVYRVSAKDIKGDLDIYNQDSVREYIEGLCESKSYKQRLNDRTVDEVIEHFYYNRKLVLLNIENYPEEVFNTLSNYVTYNCSKDLSQIEYSIAAKKLDLQDVLDTI